MASIFKPILFLAVIFSYSFSSEMTDLTVSNSQTNSTISKDGVASILNTTTNFVALENPSWRRRIYSLQFEKGNKEDISKQLRRTEIIFFISFPLTFLANTLFFGGSSDFNRAEYEDYISSLISTFDRGFKTGNYAYNRINHRQYNENAFNSTEFFLWINSFLWSLTIALNDPVENYHPQPDRIKAEFDENRDQFNFFNDRY